MVVDFLAEADNLAVSFDMQKFYQWFDCNPLEKQTKQWKGSVNKWHCDNKFYLLTFNLIQSLDQSIEQIK